MFNTVVINLRNERHGDNFVYIGRGSKWGNPYTHIKGKTKAQFLVKNREEAIDKYEEWIRNQPDLLKDLHELKGKRLGCYCRPYNKCHGDVLCDLIEEFCSEDEDEIDFWEDTK
jgi:hypothetical protein